MKQLANYFELIPLAYIESIDGDQITFKPNFSATKFFTDNDLFFTENEKASSGNKYLEQNLPVILSNLSEIQKSVLKFPTFLLIINDTDENTFIWGEIDLPVKKTSDNYLNTISLKFTRDSVNSLF